MEGQLAPTSPCVAMLSKIRGISALKIHQDIPFLFAVNHVLQRQENVETLVSVFFNSSPEIPCGNKFCVRRAKRIWNFQLYSFCNSCVLLGNSLHVVSNAFVNTLIRVQW